MLVGDSLGNLMLLLHEESFGRLGSKVYLGHDGAPCLIRMLLRTNGQDGPLPMDDEEWVDTDRECIPPHLCPPSHFDYLTVIDITGIHFLTINYCNCYTTSYIQPHCSS